jgi:hypothetical protein
MDRINELKESVDQLSRDAENVRREQHRQTRALWIAIVAVAVAGLLFTVATLLLVKRDADQIEHNNGKFCPMISILIPAPGTPTTTTPRGKIVTARAEQLFKDFHCDE